MTDVVLTYVDGTDKIWAHDYLIYSRIHKTKYEPNSVRFRSWNNLKYVLRSIAECVPFINNLYIIVSCETQIPEFVNRKTVNIVYHNNIIPEQYLPTFNSNTIEMFMHNIPGLYENFIYLNDDMFFVNVCNENDYFDENDEPIVNVYETLLSKKNTYTLSLKNTMNLANLENKEFIPFSPKSIFRSDHSPNPMKVSLWKYYWNKYEEELDNSITRFRNQINITQELSNYHYYMKNRIKNKYNKKTRNSKYFDFVNKTSDDLKNIIFNDNILTLCINDAGVSDFKIYKNVVNKILDKKYPNKCKYEK